MEVLQNYVTLRIHSERNRKTVPRSEPVVMGLYICNVTVAVYLINYLIFAEGQRCNLKRAF